MPRRLTANGCIWFRPDGWPLVFRVSSVPVIKALGREPRQSCDKCERPGTLFVLAYCQGGSVKGSYCYDCSEEVAGEMVEELSS